MWTILAYIWSNFPTKISFFINFPTPIGHVGMGFSLHWDQASSRHHKDMTPEWNPCGRIFLLRGITDQDLATVKAGIQKFKSIQ